MEKTIKQHTAHAENRDKSERSENLPRIIVIGAGLAGLSAGCYGQMAGYNTRIFELGSTPGGVCTAWKRKGHTFDGCISWLIGTRPGDELMGMYRELGALDAIKLRPVEEFMRYIDQRTGRSFSFTSDMQRTRAKLIELAPQDRKVIEGFFADAMAMSRLQTPVEDFRTMSLWGRLKLMYQWRKVFMGMRRLGVTASEYAARIQDPWVRRIIEHLFDPGGPVLFHMMTAGWLFGRNMSRIEGDSLEFARGIERRYLSLGGEIQYNAPVSKIIVEGGRAVGVRLKDGSEHRADFVISAADLHHTVYDMLGGRYVTEQLTRMFSSWRMFTPIVIVSLGLQTTLPKLAYSWIMYLKEPFKAGAHNVTELYVRKLSEHVIQAFFETDFKTWQTLRDEDMASYKAEKDRLALDITRRLETLVPGIADAVDVTDVATPATFYRYCNNYKGAYEGWVMNMESFRNPVAKTLPGLGGFCLAGQWVEPGGGVPTALISGRKAIGLIKRGRL